jgi:hypothetical protein
MPQDEELKLDRGSETVIKKILTGVRSYRYHRAAVAAWWRREVKVTPKRK